MTLQATATASPASPAKSSLLLDPAFMARLDQLDVVSRKVLAGKMKGERRSKRRGQSVEFADYRNYTIGDDLRFIDWNIYARSTACSSSCSSRRRTRRCTSCSTSARAATTARRTRRVPEEGRGRPRLRRAGQLQPRDRRGHLRRRRRRHRRAPRAAEGVADDRLHRQAQAAGSSHFTEAAKRFALQHRGKGVCVVLSDFFVKEGFEAGLRYVAGGRYDLFCVQALSPQEIDPDLQGDLKLRDLEDDDMAEVSITQPLIKQYKANLNAYCQS
jgi:hypothetical protein